jgi:hypothetical protein
MSLAAESPTSNQSATEDNGNQEQLKQFRALALRSTIATRYGSEHQTEKSSAEHARGGG